MYIYFLDWYTCDVVPNLSNVKTFRTHIKCPDYQVPSFQGLHIETEQLRTVKQLQKEN